ncbi:hypothetical protein MACH09_26940 [Vibrio sp. MACH09]|uniref:hypothetical protein n=1 Tax=Vibrio sp. MACH09 TaxID=3025122 RepID=UPI00278E6ADA|nr:hypothetical protein [Vibrio sp. MACH09]GLO62186.1 hypothetical protein MACH09_26940 [Vibrio sp. MACH09]
MFQVAARLTLNEILKTEKFNTGQFRKENIRQEKVTKKKHGKSDNIHHALIIIAILQT